MISQNSIEQLKSVAKIEDYLQAYIKLKKKGANYVGSCPFHNENTPSFTINPAKQFYKCFGCGKSGDVLKFIVEHDKIPFFEAAKKLADHYNYTLEIEGVKKEFVPPLERLEKLSAAVIKRFEERGISNNTTLRFKISESVEWMPKADKAVPVICFNYFRNEQLVNIKFRGANRDFKMNTGSELIFYNLDAIKNDRVAIIVEGEFDCLSMYEAGFYNVVSVPNGAATGKMEYMDNCWQYFEDKEQVILMVDNDDAGTKLREELARRLGKNRCLTVEYPAGCKDANDVLVKHGKDAIKQVVDDATEWPMEGIIEMAELYPEVMDFFENGYPEGIKTNIEGFDDHLTLSPGQLTVVTGTPGSGKSEFVDYIMTSCTKFHQWRFGVCSFENQPSSLHVTKISEKLIGKSFAFRSNPYSRMTKEELEDSLDIIADHYFFININKVDVTLSGILEKAKELVTRKGIKGLLIDPWNYIEHKVPNGYTETQYVSEALTALKSFAITYGVHVFLVAHPTKMKKEGNVYEIPTLYSISGSAHFFNKTDNGFTIVRDFNTNEVTVYIQKVRFSWSGKVGSVKFRYNIEKRQYQPIDN